MKSETVVDRFEGIVAEYPDNFALYTERGGLVTYRELNVAANRIAHAILSIYGDGNDAVMLFFSHGERAYIETVMGALKARKIVVAVNVDRHTTEWGQRGFLDHGFMDDTYISKLRDITGTELILTDMANWKMVERIAQGLRVLNTELQFKGPGENPGLNILPTDLATIMHTTGTTGEPKAVKRYHGMELQNILIANDPPTLPTDRTTLFRTANTAATADMYFALLNGARLCPHNITAGDLTEWVVRQKITYFRGLGTAFRKLDYERGGGFPHVRVINIGGESIVMQDVENYRKYFSDDCKLVVRYSASECGHITHFTIDKKTELPDGVVPVGFPLGDKKLAVYGEEIAVGSEFLAGYLNPTTELKKKFRQEGRLYMTGDRGYFLPTGALVHLGRIT